VRSARGKAKNCARERRKALTTYGWIDKAKRQRTFQSSRAMELTLADSADEKANAANPIANARTSGPGSGRQPLLARPVPSLSRQQ